MKGTNQKQRTLKMLSLKQIKQRTIASPILNIIYPINNKCVCVGSLQGPSDSMKKQYYQSMKTSHIPKSTYLSTNM